MKSKSSFKHEALVEIKSAQQFLDALKKSLGKGQLEFSDDKGTLTLEPEGLVYLKVKASDEEGRQQIELKLRWDKWPDEIDSAPPSLKS